MNTSKNHSIARPIAAALLVSAAAVGLPASSSAATGAVRDVDPVSSAAQARATQWYLDSLGVTRAQQVSKGGGVRVCVVEQTLVQRANRGLAKVKFGSIHAELGSSLDSLDHGTHMVLLIAGDGAQGTQGVAPEATIDVESVRDGQGDVLGAIKRCADQGAKVISVSLVGTRDWKPAVAYAQQRDAVIVGGTGNDHGQRVLLGDLSGAYGVLNVTGTDETLRGDRGSTFGPPYWAFGRGAAPEKRDVQGTVITGPSADRHWTSEDYGGCDGFSVPASPSARRPFDGPVCGTSAATAITSGVVALVRAAHPELNAANVINRVIRTARRPVGEKPGTKLPSVRFGFGIVDAYAAVTAKVPLVQDNPLGSMATGGRGVWDPRVVPQRAEPTVGASPAPSELSQVRLDDPTKATARPTPTETATATGTVSSSTAASGGASQAAGASQGSSVPGWAVPAGLGALVLAAAAGTALVRRRHPGKRA